MSVNKQILVGHLGKDPELRETATGNVCNLSVATSENWTTKDGEKKTETQWHNVSVWGRAADNCAKYLAKGSMVYIEGKTVHRKDEQKDKWYTSVQAGVVNFLSKPQTTDDAPVAKAKEENVGDLLSSL